MESAKKRGAQDKGAWNQVLEGALVGREGIMHGPLGQLTEVTKSE